MVVGTAERVASVQRRLGLGDPECARELGVSIALLRKIKAGARFRLDGPASSKLVGLEELAERLEALSSSPIALLDLLRRPMQANEVRRIRRNVGGRCTQCRFGELVRLNNVTVCRIEREQESPSPLTRARLRAFHLAKKQPSLRERYLTWLLAT